MSIFTNTPPAAGDTGYYVAWLPSNAIYEDAESRNGRMTTCTAEQIHYLAVRAQDRLEPWVWAPMRAVEDLLSGACRQLASQPQAAIDRATALRIEAAILRAEEIERMASTLRHVLGVTPSHTERTTCHAHSVTGLRHARAAAFTNEQATNETAAETAAQH